MSNDLSTPDGRPKEEQKWSDTPRTDELIEESDFHKENWPTRLDFAYELCRQLERDFAQVLAERNSAYERLKSALKKAEKAS